MNIFSSFKSEKPKSALLALGKHIVSLISISFIDSFLNANGSAKTESIWSEPTPQIAVKVGNETGGLMHRFNGLGYLHTDSVDPDEMESLGLVDMDGYACKELENGKFERIVSEDNTEACKNILNKFFWACNVPEGTTLDELMILASEGKVNLEVEVVENLYDPDKPSKEIKSWNQVKEGEEVKQGQLELK